MSTPQNWYVSYLTSRGLTVEVAEAAGWRLLEPSAQGYNHEIADLIGETEATRVEAGILIPYQDGSARLRCYRHPWKLDGLEADEVWAATTIRWDHRDALQRRIDAGGTTTEDTPARYPDRYRLAAELEPQHRRTAKPERKFRSASNAGVHIYRPGQPAGTTTLYLVEGETRALLLRSLGFWAVAIAGTDMWHHRGETGLHPDLAADVEAAEAVVVVFDSDVDRKDGIQKALNRLVAALPPTKTAIGYVDGLGKDGLDDYLAGLPGDQRAAAVRTLWTLPADTEAALAKVRDLRHDDVSEVYVARHLRRCWDLELVGRYDKEAGVYVRGYEDHRKALDSDLLHPEPRCRLDRQILSDLLDAYAPPRIPIRVGTRPDGSAELFEVGPNNLLRLTGAEAMAAPLHRWASDLTRHTAQADVVSGLVATARLCPGFRVAWPQAWRFAGETAPAMHEIPAPAPGPTPAWDEFLGRLSCPETFLAWIWSVVEARHRGRQCLYLHGPEGQDGKTYVSEVIGTMMGPLHTPMSDWRASDPHSTSALVGKRFATKDDLKNPHIGNLQLFRSVLSGSTEQINEKYKQPRKEFLYVRVMITANRMPEISNAGASESSRFLIVRVGASSIKSDPTWPDRLKAELPHLLHRARAAYSRLCLNHGDIAVTPPTATLIDEAQGEESDRWAVLAEAVEFGDGKNATAAELNGLLTRLGLKGYEAKDAQAWLRSRPGVDRAMVRRGPSVVRGWKGLRVRAEQTGVADDTFEPANTNATPEAANN